MTPGMLIAQSKDILGEDQKLFVMSLRSFYEEGN